MHHKIPAMIIDPVALFREGVSRTLQEADFHPVWCSDRPPVGPLRALAGQVSSLLIIGTEIDDHVANLVIAQLLFLEAEDPERDIQLYINSPGGSITSGMAIYDTMQYVRPDVVTACVGQAASMAALLLTAGTPKRRFSLPNSRILIHQPSMSGLSGQATDIDIHAKEILRMRSVINRLLADHSKQSIEKIEQDVERDFIMSAQQAKEYGLIDEIIQKHR